MANSQADERICVMKISPKIVLIFFSMQSRDICADSLQANFELIMTKSQPIS